MLYLHLSPLGVLSLVDSIGNLKLFLINEFLEVYTSEALGVIYLLIAFILL